MIQIPRRYPVLDAAVYPSFCDVRKMYHQARGIEYNEEGDSHTFNIENTPSARDIASRGIILCRELRSPDCSARVLWVMPRCYRSSRSVVDYGDKEPLMR